MLVIISGDGWMEWQQSVWILLIHHVLESKCFFGRIERYIDGLEPFATSDIFVDQFTKV